MKPYILILSLILTLPLAGHTATDDYTIPKKHRVIQEATLQPGNVPIGTELTTPHVHRTQREYIQFRGTH